MNRFFKNIFILITSFILLSAISIISVLWTYSNDLPDYKFLKSYKPPVSSKVYSGNGDLVADFSKEKRVFVPFNSIPKNVINAFLSAEDKNFFKHPGVDAKGVIRAVINNISNILSSKRLEGASTITQQVAKNFLLTNEVSLNRKIKEAILAFRIERALSKERILELYLNQIYLGSGAYGVAAASLEYFDKSIKDLNYSEAALLAALPKAPSRYNPYRDPDIAKFRRNLVLKNLLDNNYLTSEWYEKLTKDEIILKKNKKIYLEDAQYFIEDVRKSVIETLSYDKVYKQGFNINTPIDLNLQTIATKSLRDGLIAYDKRKGWRGPLTNKIYNSEWKKDLEKYKLENSINWKLAIVKKINKFSAEIETEDNIEGVIEYQSISWTKKEFNKLLKPGEGRLAIVMPYQLVSGPEAAYLRYWILKECSLIAVIDLPGETFQPHTGTKTSLVVLKRRKKVLSNLKSNNDKSVFMSTPRWIGHDRRGNPVFERTPDGKISNKILTDFPDVEEDFNNFKENFNINDSFETEIVNIVDFGIFVKVLDEIDGMVHISDLNWDEKECEKIIKNLKKGEKIKVKILDINADKERISLGVKHLNNDPVQDFIEANPINSKVTGRIIHIDDKGLKIELDNEKQIFGFIKKSNLFFYH